MTKTDIGIYRGLKEKFDPEVHVGFFITTDTGELLLGDQSLGQTISGWEINDGVLILKLNTGKDIRVTFPEATETAKGLLSAADKAQLNALQANLDSKVDKVTGKSLVEDALITKLTGLPTSETLTQQLSDAKAAGTNAQSGLNAHKQDTSNPHAVTKEQVGLGNVTNDAQVKRSEMGVANGVATLDADGKVPASQLPSYVDDIIDVYATYSKSDTGVLSNVTLYLDAAHTQLVTGEAGKIYQNIADGEPQYQFRWTGTIFSQTGASSLILGEVTGTAYDGAKGKANADNIAKIKGTSLSHIKDAAPVTTAADKVSINYECYEGNQYGAAGTDHTADIPAATTAKAGVMSAADKTKLENLNSKLVVADEEDVTAVDGKIKFKDRDTTNGMGYKILRLPENGILTQDMINQANTIYEIRYNFDLNGATITIPENCTLKFEGGKLSNGSIIFNLSSVISNTKNIFNNILMTGSASEIRSSYIEGDGVDKLNILSQLESSILFDEDLQIDRSYGDGIFKASKILFSGKIILGIDIDVFILDSDSKIKEIEGLYFNGNSHHCRNVVLCTNFQDLNIRNIRVENIKGGENLYVNILLLRSGLGLLNIDNIRIENISSIGNGIFGDAVGNISGIYVTSPNATINVSNCYFTNLVNYNTLASEVQEDISCIYISSVQDNTRPAIISNIYGYNFGKRLIKGDTGNIIINNVTAENTKEKMCLAVIGLNDRDSEGDYYSAIINNISFKGFASYVVASSVHNTTVSGVVADFAKPSEVTSLCILGVFGNNLMLSNTICNGNGMLATVTKNHNVIIRDSLYTVSNDSTPYRGGILYLEGTVVDLYNCKFVLNLEISFKLNYAFTTPVKISFKCCSFEVNAESPNYLFTTSNIAGRELIHYDIEECTINIHKGIRSVVGDVYNLTFKGNRINWDEERTNTIAGCNILVNNNSLIEISDIVINRKNPSSTYFPFYITSQDEVGVKEITLFNISDKINCSDNLYWKSSIVALVNRDFSLNLGLDAIGCTCYKGTEEVTWDGEKWSAYNSWKIIR